MRIAAFVQSRMSSRRFPGKMLAPFRGRPVLDHVTGAVRDGVPTGTPIVVLTSDQPSDDPLAVYATSRGVSVFRGPLHDVLGRFRRALESIEGAPGAPRLDWVLRICGDSPLLSPKVVSAVVAAAQTNPDADLVTTTHPRTFPAGQNVEMVRASTLRGLDDRDDLTEDDREHVTRAIHVAPTGYRIVNVTSARPALATQHLAVDTVDDLLRLEACDVQADLAALVE